MTITIGIILYFLLIELMLFTNAIKPYIKKVKDNIDIIKELKIGVFPNISYN